MAANKNEIKIFCVRADGGEFTEKLIKGGYFGIGWLPNDNLSSIKSKEELITLYQKEYPEDISKIVISQQVGQISRFLFDISEGDYVITPAKNSENLYYGVVLKKPYYYSGTIDGCRYRHRKRIRWNRNPIQRGLFSIPFQYTMRSSLSVFNVNHTDNFFSIIGKPELVKEGLPKKIDYYTSVLERVLELSSEEFEKLITHVLEAMGFETQHVGKFKDGGVDITGELNVNNLVRIKLIVQVKRYKLGSRISENVVTALRSKIGNKDQGAFIATCGFQKKAYDVATEQGFTRIGLINGQQLVDLLVEYWDEIPEDFRELLSLKIGLIPN